MTHLKIRWENGEGQYTEEVWERENDGVLYSCFMAIVTLINSVRRLT
jgi:hypothetical protein